MSTMRGPRRCSSTIDAGVLPWRRSTVSARWATFSIGSETRSNAWPGAYDQRSRSELMTVARKADESDLGRAMPIEAEERPGQNGDGQAPPAVEVAPVFAPIPSAFPPIAAFPFLSAFEANALIAPSGRVEWMCLPRPASPSVFAAMLDRA